MGIHNQKEKKPGFQKFHEEGERKIGLSLKTVSSDNGGEKISLLRSIVESMGEA